MNGGAAVAEARQTGGAAATAEDDGTSPADDERFAANGGRTVLPFVADGDLRLNRGRTVAPSWRPEI
ncbi:hypothetical protein SESBI_32551 [Sesbania bispinosa]|nr:hypothetical protein SESBI_32551 [Sesbania bispinosa]